eukprot:TRINITY_DN1792_c0_g2_i1.p1 TRINITY_DN1792_c0_g2~~TRINITY_DN1792_c0_g2_i1.p1  ORF type:complete len:193 (-),score=40.77 TRINITY_DN1792_c0_g2_i1:29-607(-)
MPTSTFCMRVEIRFKRGPTLTSTPVEKRIGVLSFDITLVLSDHVPIFNRGLFDTKKPIPNLRRDRDGFGAVAHIPPPVPKPKEKKDLKEKEEPKEDPKEILQREIDRFKQELRMLRASKCTVEVEQAKIDERDKKQEELDQIIKGELIRKKYRAPKRIPIILSYNWKKRTLQVQFYYEVWTNEGDKKILHYV